MAFNPDDFATEPVAKSGFDPDAYLKPEEEEGPGLLERAVTTIRAPLREGIRGAKQFALGAPRAMGNLATMMAPAGMQEAIAANPQVYDTVTEGGTKDLPSMEDYAGVQKDVLTQMGVEGENSPKDAYERIMSGAGQGAATGAMMPFGGLPGAIGFGAVGGAGGAAAEELAPEEHKGWANLIGSLVSSFGVAGAASILRNFTRGPMRTLAGDTPLPATRGMQGEPRGRNTTLMQTQEEEALASGAKGYPAQRIMERNRLAREEAMTQEEAALQPAVKGSKDVIPDEEVGNRLDAAIKGKAEDYRSAGDKLFNEAWAQNAVGHDVRPSQTIGDQLRVKGIEFDATNYPGAKEAMNIITRNLEGPGATGAGGYSVSMNAAHEVGKQLNAIKAPYGTADGRAIGVIKDAFRDWQKSMGDNALFAGDKAAAESRKTATKTWSRYLEMTRADPKKDYTQVLAKIIDKDVSGEGVLNYLMNNASIGGADRSSHLVRFMKRTFGRDSEEVELLRHGLWNRIARQTTEVDGRIVPAHGTKGNVATAKAIRDMITGKGAPLSRALYTEAERNKMLSYAEALMKTNPKLDQPSRSGHFIFRHAYPLAQGVLSILGGAGGYFSQSDHDRDWTKVIAAGLVLPLIRSGVNYKRALDATTNIRPATSVTQRTLTGAAAGSARSLTEGEE